MQVNCTMPAVARRSRLDLPKKFKEWSAKLHEMNQRRVQQREWEARLKQLNPEVKAIQELFDRHMNKSKENEFLKNIYLNALEKGAVNEEAIMEELAKAIHKARPDIPQESLGEVAQQEFGKLKKLIDHTFGKNADYKQRVANIHQIMKGEFGD